MVAIKLRSRFHITKLNCIQSQTTYHPHSNAPSQPGEEGSLGLFGLRGMGGVGKTTTAIALAQSERVQKIFGADNIWWITVGQTSSGAAVLEEFAQKVCRRQFVDTGLLVPFWVYGYIRQSVTTHGK